MRPMPPSYMVPSSKGHCGIYNSFVHDSCNHGIRPAAHLPCPKPLRIFPPLWALPTGDMRVFGALMHFRNRAPHITYRIYSEVLNKTATRRISQPKDTVHFPAPKNAVVSSQVSGALPQHSIRLQGRVQGSAKARRLQMVSSMAHEQ